MKYMRILGVNAVEPDAPCMNHVERVLVIDDDPTSIFLTTRILKSMGIGEQTQTARNGLEGLELFKEAVAQNRVPQLVLLDLKMPVMDGFGFLAELEKLGSESLAQAKVVLLSSSQNPWEMEKAKKYVAAAFCHKPLTKEKLQRVLDTAR